MKTEIKCAICFALGATCGSLVTYFLTKNRIQKQADADVEDMRKYVEEKLRPFRLADKMNEKAAEMEDAVMQEEARDVTEGINNETYVNYTKLAREYTGDKEFPTDEILGPRLITEEEFCDPVPYYDKISLEYSRSEGKLYDISNDVEVSCDIIGDSIVRAILDNDEAYTYIRNDKISTDYEATVID